MQRRDVDRTAAGVEAQPDRPDRLVPGLAPRAEFAVERFERRRQGDVALPDAACERSSPKGSSNGRSDS
jgi:hypothetical protein